MLKYDIFHSQTMGSNMLKCTIVNMSTKRSLCTYRHSFSFFIQVCIGVLSFGSSLSRVWPSFLPRIVCTRYVLTVLSQKQNNTQFQNACPLSPILWNANSTSCVVFKTMSICLCVTAKKNLIVPQSRRMYRTRGTYRKFSSSTRMSSMSDILKFRRDLERLLNIINKLQYLPNVMD